MGKKPKKSAAVTSAPGAAASAADPDRLRLLLAPLLVAVAFLHGLVSSWHKLGELMVDTGRELDLPRRLLEGAQLYVDARYYWGPLAPYLNKGLYALFGVSLDTLRWGGIASAALTCAGLYLVARHFLGRWTSAAVGVAFVHLGAFGHLGSFPIFNFVLPFNFSATWGMALAVWALLFLLQHQKSGARGHFFASAALAGLASLTKVEVAFAVLAAHGAFALGARRTLSKTHVMGWAGGLAIPAAVYGALWARVGPGLWNDNLAALVGPASRHYIQRTMGLLDPGESAVAIVTSLGVLVAAVGAAWLAAKKPQPVVTAALALALFGAFTWLSPDVPTRALVVVLVLGGGHALWRVARQQDAPAEPRDAQALALWAFGLACVARIALRAIPSHYGFYLLPVCLVCLALLVSDGVPRLAGVPDGGRPAFAVAAAAMLLGMAAGGHRVSRAWFEAHAVPLATPRGQMLVLPNSGEPFALAALAKLPPGSKVVTIPQGAGLIFASGLTHGDSMFSYLPMELPDPAADLALAQRWEQSPPDAVVWWRLNLMKSFGVQGFGIDYAQQAGKWIERNYKPVTDARGEFVVLVRKN